MDKLKQTFPNFEEELLQEIEQVGIHKSFPKGELILNQNQYIRSIPLILKGHIKITRHGENSSEIILYHLSPGETCATTLQCCERHSKSKITAISESEVDLILIPVEYFEKWTKKYPTWQFFILMNYKEKFNNMMQIIDKISFGNLNERIEEYLTEKMYTIKSNTIEITHQQIAYDLNSSREVISKYLKKLENKKKLELKRGKIILNQHYF